MTNSKTVIQNYFDLYNITPGYPKISPTYLQIELTNRCNLKCPACIRADSKSTKETFPLQDFRDLIDSLPTVEHVSFVGGGETLLVKNINEYVEICKRANIRSSCTTNGLLVQEQLFPLIEAGLSKLAISIDAIDDASINDLRPGMNINKINKALDFAVMATNESETALSVAITLNINNIKAFPKIIKHVIGRGIKDVSVESTHHWGIDKSLNEYSLFSNYPDQVINYIEEGLKTAKEQRVSVNIFDYRRLISQEKSSLFHCPWPWDSMFITHKGDVTPCCIAIEPIGKANMGSIKNAEAQKIWQGRAYHELRDSFFNNSEWDICSGCVFRIEFGILKNKTPEQRKDYGVI